MNKNFEAFGVASASISNHENHDEIVKPIDHDEAVEAQRQLVYKLSQERNVQEEKHVNTPQMIAANKNVMEGKRIDHDDVLLETLKANGNSPEMIAANEKALRGTQENK